MLGLLIFFLALFLRLYDLVSKLPWGMDEDYWAYLVHNFSSGYHISLIGGNIGGTGFHTTPYAIYLLGILTKVFSSSPVFLGFLAVLLGATTATLIYVLGKKMFGSKIAATAAFLYAVSPIFIVIDQKFWNPMFLPLLSLLLFYGAYKKSALLLGLVTSFFFAVHGTAILAAITSVVVLLKKPKSLVIYLLLVGLSLSPLALFEVKHDFIQTKRFLTDANKTTEQGNRFATVGAHISTAFIYPLPIDISKVSTYACKTYSELPIFLPGLLISLLILSFVAYKAAKKEKPYQLLLLFFVLNVLGLYFFNEAPKRYYLPFIYLPLVFGLAAILIGTKHKVLIGIVLTLLFVTGLSKTLTSYNPYSLKSKLLAVEKGLSLSKGSPFDLAVTSSDPCQIYGYRYFFTFFNAEPVTSYADRDFLWLYENNLPKKTGHEGKMLIHSEKNNIDVELR